jgi:hypothetical protein
MDTVNTPRPITRTLVRSTGAREKAHLELAEVICNV